MATLAPPSASRTTAARPMPREPPVTSATLPSKSLAIDSSSELAGAPRIACALTLDPPAAIFRRPEGSFPAVDYLSPYLPVLVLLLVAGILCVVIGILASVLGPQRITLIKESA